MDSYLLKAAVLYALSAASRTCTAVDDILQSAYTATALFDSLTYELLDLKVPLERLGDPDLVIPRQLQPPILKIVRSCGDVLSHIDEWVEKTPRDAHQDAIPSTDNLQQLHSNLCTCRRALQLALEAVNLAGPEDDAIDANFFGTYLDHDTRRLLALIRRMLQQVQEGDREDPLKQALWSSLDEVRLYIQSKCRNQEDKKPSLIQALEAASCGGSQMSERDELSMASRMTPEPGPADSPPAAVATENRKGTNKLVKALARLSMGAPKKLNSLSVPSLQSSPSRPSSERTMEKTLADDSTSVASSALDTCGQSSVVSYTSRGSTSSYPSSSGSRELSNTFIPMSAPKHTQQQRRTLTSMDEEDVVASPSHATPTATNTPSPVVNDIVDHNSQSNILMPSSPQHTAGRTLAGGSQLPSFATSPPDKIVIDPFDIPAIWRPDYSRNTRTELVRTRLLSNPGKDHKAPVHGSAVFYADLSPSAYIIASKYGDKTIKVHGLPQCNVQASLKISFYIQMQERSRDFFVTSHAIISETRSLMAVAAGFGDSLEIWNWESKKKLQVIDSVFRWTAARKDMFETNYPPLACYREGENAIYLFPVAQGNSNNFSHHAANSKMNVFGSPTTIHLAKAGLPHIPTFPEMVYSATGPLLVAAAGPRPPRPGHPPPEHAAMLMVWDLAADPAVQSSLTRRSCMPTRYAELQGSLPCGLATHGSTVVSIWIPHHVRVIGRPGAWQVEPVTQLERYVLVWDFETDRTDLFAIPNENTIACISPDCRYVAYRQGPGPDTKEGRDVCMVILDAMNGGHELWRTPTPQGASGLMRGCDQLMDLSRITFISFSSDGDQFIVGDATGSVGIYEHKMVDNSLRSSGNVV